MAAKEARQLLRRSHERRGTVEPARDVLENRLGGRVPPSRPFGVNAAWRQRVVLAADLSWALQRLTLPEDWGSFRPRRRPPAAPSRHPIDGLWAPKSPARGMPAGSRRPGTGASVPGPGTTPGFRFSCCAGLPPASLGP